MILKRWWFYMLTRWSDIKWLHQSVGSKCPALNQAHPRDDRAWWAPVYGVAQSRTWLERLSSSSSSSSSIIIPGWGWVLLAQVSHMRIRPLMSSPSEVVPIITGTCWTKSRFSSHTFILVIYNQTTCPGMHFELILKKNYLVPSIIIMHWIFPPHIDIDLLNLKHLKWATVSATLPWPWEGSATYLWSWLLGYESCAGLFFFFSPWCLAHSKPSDIFCFPSFIIVSLEVLFFRSVRYEEIFKKRKHIWHIPIVLPNDCLY